VIRADAARQPIHAAKNDASVIFVCSGAVSFERRFVQAVLYTRGPGQHRSLADQGLAGYSAGGVRRVGGRRRGASHYGLQGERAKGGEAGAVNSSIRDCAGSRVRRQGGRCCSEGRHANGLESNHAMPHSLSPTQVIHSYSRETAAILQASIAGGGRGVAAANGSPALQAAAIPWGPDWPGKTCPPGCLDLTAFDYYVGTNACTCNAVRRGRLQQSGRLPCFNLAWRQPLSSTWGARASGRGGAERAPSACVLTAKHGRQAAGRRVWHWRIRARLRRCLLLWGHHRCGTQFTWACCCAPA
jgi:hypothetical protein